MSHATQILPQGTIQLPAMAAFGSVVIAPQALLAIDASGYVVGSKDRTITVFIVGPHQIELYGADADAFKAWWDTVTGTNRVVPAPAGLKV